MTEPYFATLPRLLLRQAESNPDSTALREKEWGIWQTYTWEEYKTAVAEFAAGLAKLGIDRGDIIILIGDNRPEWLWAELGVQALGGMALGLYQDSSADEVEYIFRLTEARLVVAEDQEQVDKMLEIREKTNLEHIIYHDPRGLSSYTAEGLFSFDRLRGMDRDGAKKFPARVEKIAPEDPALVVTTSGTTGRPKLAVLSHRNLLAMACNLGRVDPKYRTDEFVSFLPLAWIGEQMMAAASALYYGFCVNFPEEPDTVQTDIREIGPHLIFSPPPGVGEPFGPGAGGYNGHYSF
ncbi:MAG: AMP-binding protein [Desulfonatronovibrionaceae bacterium]